MNFHKQELYESNIEIAHVITCENEIQNLQPGTMKALADEL